MTTAGPMYVVVQHAPNDPPRFRRRLDAVQPISELVAAQERADLLECMAHDAGRTDDTYRVYELRQVAAGPDVPEWLSEVLHVVWGFAEREHEGLRVLTPWHAQAALDNVPEEVLRAAKVDWTARANEEG